MSKWILFKDKAPKNGQRIVVKFFQDRNCTDKECLNNKDDFLLEHAIYFNHVDDFEEKYDTHHNSVVDMATKEVLAMESAYKKGSVCWCQWLEA